MHADTSTETTEPAEAARGTAGTEQSDRPVLRVAGLSKRFGGTQALRDVDLVVAAGEIHALVGPNGSGKSTLIKMLAGYHHAEPGAGASSTASRFDLGGHGSRHDRLRFVHQELGLVGELSAIGQPRAQPRLRPRPLRQHPLGGEGAADDAPLLERFGVGIDVRRPPVGRHAGQRTVVAIAAALQGWEGGRGVLVLDEPTAVLPPREVARLFDDRARRSATPGTSVLYVSHRLDEIFAIGGPRHRDPRRAPGRHAAGRRD